jgi:hypothetical protein
MHPILRRVTMVFAVSALAAAALSAPRHVTQANPAIGKWKLNVAKSTFDPGPAPQSQMRSYEEWGCDIEHVVQEGTDGSGKATFAEFAARFDSKDYPRVNRGSSTAGTIALTKADSSGSTVRFVQKEDRQVSISGTRTLSPDHKTMTIRYRGTNVQGEPMSATMIFERQ